MPRDPQSMSGTQQYPPIPGPCVREGCGHAWTAHRIGKGEQRMGCTVHGRRAKCECRRYRAAESEPNDD